ncbi:peptidoglycan editing factor PgeF [Shewanella avicenniae]|uniref:Purine nucleoside phosphorylase n=1 Tax=Shewanella avicenniae TaxID=2814294 RepID=A0ABX7QNK2_9GAMM|nr:peptidoglycan editing factor PgeF [Shewanella avicenniae]QSX33042.1 peptidoglycan editing factor PgeF [Shewanella avicenniae]
MIPADWFIPAGVHIAFTDRTGGVSKAPYASLNLGDHVDDDPVAVTHNRALLIEQLSLPAAPQWLTQVHGVDVVEVDIDANRRADGAFSCQAEQVLAVMTADCLPVLVCDAAGGQIAALHAGWRGLCHGILEAGIAKFAKGSELYAYLGPAIGPSAFEVGAEVRAAFMANTPQAETCFIPSTNAAVPDKYLADLVKLAQLRLQAAGVAHIYALGDCTYTLADRYFSYRRSPITGRMASLIWRD